VRKLLWLVAVAVAALTLAACVGGDDGGGDASSRDGSGGASQTAALNLKTEGRLTAGAEFPVAGFLELPIENPKGFEVDFAEALARELGIPEVTWVNTPFSGLFSPAPKNFDVAINEITVTPERAKVVDFSDPYLDANQGFLVTKGGPGEAARSIADMKDLQFGFQATTTGGDFVNDEIRPSKQPREYSTLGAATRALANGQIDAFVTDVAIGSSIVKQLPDDIAMTGQFESGRLTAMRKRWFPGTENLPVFE